MKTAEILNQFSAYRDASDSLQEEMARYGETVHLPEGAFYFREGDSCCQLALIGTGRLRVFRAHPSGRELTLYEVQGGEICSLNLCCLISGHNCPASARVEVPVDAVVFPGEVFHRWMNDHQQFRSYVFGLLANQVSAMISLVGEIAFNRMDRRLADYLQSKFGLGQERVEEDLAVTHEHIAAELGTAREVVSRLLKEFERQGAIRLSRAHIHLKDAEILRLFGDSR